MKNTDVLQNKQYKYFIFNNIFAISQSAGSTKNGRDSHSNRLGIKVNHGEQVKKGEIIVRQQGKKFTNCLNTKLAKNFSIFAVKDGKVRFFSKKGKRFVSVIEN